MEPWVAPGDGADYVTALPFELRARIASYLPFQQVPQLEILSRPWRHIHRHAPVVNVDLDDFSTSRRTAGLNTSRSRSPAAGRIAPHPR
jgi:hypothetical protein